MVGIQDPDASKQLDAAERVVVEETIAILRRGGSPRRVLFFGLPAMPDRYRGASFYTNTPALADYFAARQWYATMAFRLESDEETERAIRLSRLVHSDKELAELHRRLNAPYDALLGPADDATVDNYAQTAAAVLGAGAPAETIVVRLDDFRTAAADLPTPQVNDQFLNASDYARFAEVTKGFRLLPPRRVPSAVLFMRTVDPAVKSRMFPSGIDVFATGELASEAGRDALKQMEEDPAVTAAVLDAEPAPLPDSLHGRALRLLTQLQTSLPEAAPIAINREWSVYTRAEALRQFGTTADAHRREAFEEIPNAESHETYADVVVPKLPLTERIRAQVSRLLPLLDDKTVVNNPDYEDERMCDIAASALAEAADLEHQSPDDLEEDDPDRFLEYVRKSIRALKDD